MSEDTSDNTTRGVTTIYSQANNNNDNNKIKTLHASWLAKQQLTSANINVPER